MAGSETLIRARNADGTYAADDPSTPDVDEAWVVTDNNDTTTGGEA
jgi:hypothetical protein